MTGVLCFTCGGRAICSQTTSEGRPDTNDAAGQQYTIGIFNRRVARQVESDRARSSGIGALREGRFLCTCGREGCEEVIVMPIEEYRFIRASLHRFVVAPGHATEVDELIRSGDDYDVVEVRPEHRAEPPRLS